MEIFLLAGEASGDERGAELIRELRKKDPLLSFSGMGGPKMKTEGMEILTDLSHFAVVGIFEVLKHYRIFKRSMDQLLQEIERRKPLAVIGIDYPGFNLRLLQKVRRFQSKEKKPKLIQYISPQLWAWDENRKWKMAEYLDLLLCLFPFEPAIYSETKLKAIFVGHPLAQSICHPEEGRDPNLIALFPGSREKELRAHMPVFIELEKSMRKSNPQFQFSYASNHSGSTDIIRSYSPHAQIELPSFLYANAAIGIVCSGTATLEAAMAGLPICVIYRVAWPTYWLGRFLIKVPHLAMPNLLAGRAFIKELVQSEFTPAKISYAIKQLLQNQDLRKEIFKNYEEIRCKLGEGNAAEKAATEILTCISKG